MQYTSILSLMTVSASLVAAIPHAAPAPSSASIVLSNPSNDVEGNARAQNVKQVQCNSYIGLGHVNEAVAPCKPFCGKAGPDTNAGNITSVTCLSGGLNLPIYTDSVGKYYPGVCRCNIGLLDQITNDVVMALPAIADIGCEILVDAFELVVSVGVAAIPGAGEVEAADAGMQGLVKAGQAVKKAGKGADDLLSWLNPCGKDQFTDKVDAVFGDLTLGMVGGGGTGNINADANAPVSSTSSQAAPSSSSQAAPKPAPTTSQAASSATTASPGQSNAAKLLGGPLFALNNAISAAAAKAKTTPAPKAKRTSVLSA